MTIRPMTREDLPAVARLSGELGYPVAEPAIARRFEELSNDANGLFVAANSDDGVVGWIHVVSARTLTDEPMAEIDALIVEEAARSRGVGRELVLAAEAWAEAGGLATLRVRTRVTRERAHRFYEKAGFALTKTQHVFDKIVAAGKRPS
jgi:ribosomal protein S18 acetylase RimI-like enzyme